MFLRSLRLIIDFFFFLKIEKSQTFCLKMTYTFSKKYEVTKKNDGCHFSDFGSFLEGRLRPENGSDWAENLTRSVSDKSAKKVFLARFFFSGVSFRIFPIFWEVVYPPRMAPIGLKI